MNRKRYENGQVRTREKDMRMENILVFKLIGMRKLEVNYKNGKKDGVWIEWSQNGKNKLINVVYKDGKKQKEE